MSDVCQKTVLFLRILMGCGACLFACGAEGGWFQATFEDYAPGEALSSHGVSGGAWQMGTPGLVATNVFDGVRNGIAIQTPRGAEWTFKPVEPAGEELEQVDFSICVEHLADAELKDFDGAAGLNPTWLKNGAAGYLGFTARGWIELTGAGVEPEAGVWLDGRIELRTVEAVRLVSYLVKKGETWVRLADAAGTTWFETKTPKNKAGVSALSFTGSGRFSDFTGNETADEPWRLFRWTGGAAGDWNVAENWSVGGAPTQTAPGVIGDLASVPGTVAVTRGKESGTATDLLVTFTEAGAQVAGGTATGSVDLDVSRPRAGKALAAKVVPLFGRTGTFDYAWRRAGTDRKYADRPFATTASFTPTAEDYEHWFAFTARDGEGREVAREFFFSRLPVLYLTTDDGGAPTAQKETHAGRLFVQGNDAWKSPYEGAMTIKTRGNTTLNYPKKPWKIKLDKKTKMFDIPKSKHWVLLANYNDQSMLRNRLAADFANDIGSLGMKSTWVECVLNGTWQGLYHFCEQIRIAGDRVNIHDWEDDAEEIAQAFARANGLTAAQADELEEQLCQDFTWVTSDSFSYYDASNRVLRAGRPSELFAGYTQDISGGYLFEFSEEYDERAKFKTASGVLSVRTMLNAPAYLDTNAAMFNYCQDYLQNYWDACTSYDGYSKEGRPIAAYCDYDSMVDYWLVMELVGNRDAVRKSRYAYKDQGGKLVWGPVWDFDWGMGSMRVDASGEGWKCQETRGTTTQPNSIFKEWTDHPEFCTRLWTRYWQVRDRFAAMLGDDGFIAQYTNYLAAAGHANSAKWDADYHLGAASFEADVARLVTFLTTRLAWLDAQFKDVPTLMASVQQETCTHYYTVDARRLPIAFEGRTGDRTIYRGRPLRTTFTPGGSSVATVSVFVNGERVITRQAKVGGVFDATLPSDVFTAPLGEPNCVSFVAYNTAGEVIARNYALVTQTSPGTVFILR